METGAPTISGYGRGSFQLLSPTPAKIFEQCGCRDTHSGKSYVANKKRIDRHKKEPWAIHGPRVSTGCCLSLWALLSGRRCRGMGCRPDGPQIDGNGETYPLYLRIRSHSTRRHQARLCWRFDAKLWVASCRRAQGGRPMGIYTVRSRALVHG